MIKLMLALGAIAGEVVGAMWKTYQQVQQDKEIDQYKKQIKGLQADVDRLHHKVTQLYWTMERQTLDPNPYEESKK